MKQLRQPRGCGGQEIVGGIAAFEGGQRIGPCCARDGSVFGMVGRVDVETCATCQGSGVVAVEQPAHEFAAEVP